ncbi:MULTISPECIES: hypothetical protein [Streptomyces]|uniref:hypothetical protein n=1 Tax=Streptomyces TaxID=1883 RepID=UPI001600BACA|nr:hypothetical protein [Streptomyces murinus]MBA9050793.1 ribosome-binding protein aMBF1 (putative translation factor) [Streptomyces murinus]
MPNKERVCPECNEPGYLKDHPKCARQRATRRARDNYRAKHPDWNKPRTKKPKSHTEYLREVAARELGVAVDRLTKLMEAPCEVCGSEVTERRHNSVYARKDTGAVVGTICKKCVTAAGMLGHDLERVRALLALLTSGNDYREAPPNVGR